MSNLAAIKSKSVSGAAATMTAQAVSVGIQLISTVVLARLIAPEEYGVLAMVLAVTAFAGMFRDLGLSAATVQRQEISRAQLSNLFWLNAGLGLSLTLVVAVAAPLVGWFYGKPELMPLTVVMSTTFLIGSFGAQPAALLQREMRFWRRAIATVGGSVGMLVVALTLALKGWGYWSLAWGQVASSVISTGLYLALSGFRPMGWTRRAGIGSIVKFGTNLTGFDFINYFARNLDSILIGRVWGPGPLGLYSRAYSLLMFPITNIRGPLNAVAFAAMSRLQGDPVAFRQYYRRLVGLVSFLTMPLVGALYALTEPIVLVALGPQWLQTCPIFKVLAIVAFIQTPLSLTGTIQLALGRSRRYLAMGVFAATVTASGFAVGVAWGPLGVAGAYAVTTYALLFPMLTWAFKETEIRVGDFFVEVAIPVVGTLIALTAVSGLFWAWPVHETMTKLAVGFLAFGSVYAACIAAHPRTRQSVISLLVHLGSLAPKRFKKCALV